MPMYDIEKSKDLVIQVGAQLAGVDDIETLGDNPMFTIGKTLEQMSPSGWKSNIVKGIADKIYKTEYESRIWKGANDLGITMETLDYGIVAQITSVDQPEFTADQSYALVDGRSYDPHIYRENKTETLYFEGGSPYQLKVSIPGSQINDVFFNAGDVSKFVNAIWSQVTNRTLRNKRDNELNAVATHIGNIFLHKDDNKNRCIVDLRKMYNTFTGENITKRNDFIRNGNALRYALSVIMEMSDLIQDQSNELNTQGKIMFTNQEDVRTIMLSKFYRAIEMNVYNAPNQFKTERLEIEKPKLVTRWQGFHNGSDDDLTSFSTIDVTVEGKRANLKGVVGVMFDYKSLFGTMKPSDSDAEYTAGARFTNYFRYFFYAFRSNLIYNTIVFIISDAND